MADRRRCTVFNNASPGEGKVMLVPANTTLEQFTLSASQKLGIRGKKLYLADGGQVDDVNVIRDNDSIFVSCGEPFNGGAHGQDNQSCPLYSIAVMGPGAVGKSAITLQFVQGVFVVDYDPTIEDAYRRPTSVDGLPCQMDILDTAGQEDYIALRSTWMRERDGFMLVFSVTDQNTFEEVKSFYQQLQVMHEDDMPPLVLVGNKVDMADKRMVDRDMAKALADEWGAKYIETSAKTGQNIDKAFSTVVRSIREKQPRGPTKPTKSSKFKFCTLL